MLSLISSTQWNECVSDKNNKSINFTSLLEVIAQLCMLELLVQ